MVFKIHTFKSTASLDIAKKVAHTTQLEDMRNLDKAGEDFT